MFFKRKQTQVQPKQVTHMQVPSSQPPLKQVPLGKTKYDIFGEEYRQDILRGMHQSYKGQNIRFSLTMPVPYQHEHDWPPMPFINVNLADSRVTTADNWLGYLRTNYFSEVDLVSFFEKHAPISVFGRVVIRDHKYQIVLLLPTEDEPFTLNVTYESAITPKLLNVAASTDEGYLPVNMKKLRTSKGEVYQLTHRNIVIGSTTMKKAKEIDEWLSGRSITSARFGLYNFRDGEIKPYSKVAITPSLPIQ